ncbi:hypothetical protein [Paenibacillus pedocola]|uniref:hypothetical protein n=1 Tax=Paenibacillus pedocola TaxID=3242193 RepID=UPI0028773C05|nr:hypothetical protein [Paenibacillus typhae]
MNLNYIKDTKKFNDALHMVQPVFEWEQRLPEQIFKLPFKRIKVFDFDAVMSFSFWNELERLMALSGDSNILMAVLDPHPVNYYYQEFAQYN